jgi:hypothetical protein
VESEVTEYQAEATMVGDSDEGRNVGTIVGVVGAIDKVGAFDMVG